MIAYTFRSGTFFLLSRQTRLLGLSCILPSLPSAPEFCASPILVPLQLLAKTCRCTCDHRDENRFLYRVCLPPSPSGAPCLRTGSAGLQLRLVRALPSCLSGQNGRPWERWLARTLLGSCWAPGLRKFRCNLEGHRPCRLSKWRIMGTSGPLTQQERKASSLCQDNE